MEILSPYFPDNVLNIHFGGLEGMQRTKSIAFGFQNVQKHDVDQLELRLLESGLLTSRYLGNGQIGPACFWEGLPLVPTGGGLLV